MQDSPDFDDSSDFSYNFFVVPFYILFIRTTSYRVFDLVLLIPDISFEE